MAPDPGTPARGDGAAAGGRLPSGTLVGLDEDGRRATVTAFFARFVWRPVGAPDPNTATAGDFLTAISRSGGRGPAAG